MINSDYQRKTRNKNYNKSKTNYKSKNNDFFQSIYDKNILKTKTINICNNKILINSHSQQNLMKNNNSKTIIVSRNVDSQKKYKLKKKDEDNKNFANIHEQIT